jgi:RNA polymerase sigma factor (TIGR02999 family)
MERDERQPPPGDITRLLDAWSRGDTKARDRLMPIVYGELRRRAAAPLRHEPGRTLRPTELVHEMYLRLCAQKQGWTNRGQFFAVAAFVMRRIIVDRARARRALKRGQGLRVTLTEGLVAAGPANVDLIELDRALKDLSSLDERLGRLVELRFFGGLSSQEAAQALGISLSTANREWAHAKAWLFRRLKPTPLSSSLRSS